MGTLLTAQRKLDTMDKVDQALLACGVYTQRDIDCGVCGVEELALDIDELTPEQVAALQAVGAVNDGCFLVFSTKARGQ